MIIYALLLLLIGSFIIHIAIIFLYIQTRKKVYFTAFIATVFTNIAIAMGLSIVALNQPLLIRNLNIKVFLWLLSGFFSFLIIYVQVMILRRIYRRSKDPEWFHTNYFGKKVYNQGILKKEEFLGFIISFPFFIIVGAYFFARVINLVLYGQI